MRDVLTFLFGAAAGAATALLLEPRRQHRDCRVVFRFGLVTEQPSVESGRTSAAGRTIPGHPGHVPYPDVEIVLTDTQQTTATPTFLDKKNNPIPMGTDPLAWSTDNSDLLTLTPSPDGTSCLVAAAGPLGSGSVFVKATAADGTAIIGTASVSVSAGPATQVRIDLSPPVEQP